MKHSKKSYKKQQKQQAPQAAEEAPEVEGAENEVWAHTRMSAGHVNFFFGMREQIKLYHWQTKMYSPCPIY